MWIRLYTKTKMDYCTFVGGKRETTSNGEVNTRGSSCLRII